MDLGDRELIQEDKGPSSLRCFDCGADWDISEVDVFTNNNISKYVCKECRGRCLPKEEFIKVKGVKSIKQKYRKRPYFLILLLISVISFSIYTVYDYHQVGTDFRDYHKETEFIRNGINAHLITFREDNKLIEKSKTQKIDQNELKMANERISKAKQIIFSQAFLIQRINKPKNPKVLEFYDKEMEFWENPTYSNYIKYMGEYNSMSNKYGKDFLEEIRKRVKDYHERKIKEKVKRDALKAQEKSDSKTVN